MPASDVVTMTHPDLPGRPVTATRRQFDAVWKDRGWKDAGTAPDAEPGPLPAASDSEAPPARARK
jgi:hypothetical protein